MSSLLGPSGQTPACIAAAKSKQHCPLRIRAASSALAFRGPIHRCFTSVPGPCSTSASSSAQQVLRRNNTLCRFQLDSRRNNEARRSIDEITSSRGFHDETSTRVGPVVFAADLTEESRNAMQWALRHLCLPDAEDEAVEVVHVVCDPHGFGESTAVGVAGPDGRLRFVEGPEYQATRPETHVERLVGTAYDKLSEHCGPCLQEMGIPHQIHLPRTKSPKSASVIGETLLSEAERLGARALVVASHGPGTMADYGSVAGYCFQHSNVPLVLIPSNIPWLKTLDKPWEEHTATRQAGAAGGGERVKKDKRQGKHVLLLVENLKELESHWQWVADNVCHKGDVLDIWHLIRSDPKSQQYPVFDSSLASLPTALKQALEARGNGLTDVRFQTVFYEDVPEVTHKVTEAVGSPTNHPALVVLLNYGRQGTLREALHGSVACDLSRNCPVPLVLLQPGTG